MASKRRAGCAFFILFGSLIKLLYTILNITAQFFAVIFGFFGLWIPLLYALVGVALFGFLGFNPFEWTIEGQLYIAGFAACCACSLIISIRNLVLKPIRSVVQGFREPIWKSKEENGEKGSPKRRIREPERKSIAPATAEAQQEKPEIYFSQIENVLVHEYTDRFEIFELNDGKLKLDRVEYK